ncbi:Hypothetical predicted protein [Olea europaea subsp. europaea]|uniref:Uncharacterized protein n=1 Tax=Olea europaea subsp. europaea TaxID=158383 RepID=A0A8S0PHM0_OLEEU|nr:Hypothetical predicted protein [Olea europaea subsp. europaea]
MECDHVIPKIAIPIVSNLLHGETREHAQAFFRCQAAGILSHTFGSELLGTTLGRTGRSSSVPWRLVLWSIMWGLTLNTTSAPSPPKQTSISLLTSMSALWISSENDINYK